MCQCLLLDVDAVARYAVTGHFETTEYWQSMHMRRLCARPKQSSSTLCDCPRIFPKITTK